MTPETLTALFGWMSVISIGLLLFTTLMLLILRDWVASVHGRLFDIAPKELHESYFKYLAQFKIAVLVLNVVPYLAMRIVF